MNDLIAKVSEATAAVGGGRRRGDRRVEGGGHGGAEAGLKTYVTSAATWWGIKNVSCGIFGIPVAFLVTIVVSLATRAPSKEMQDFVDSVRIPRGGVALPTGATGLSIRRPSQVCARCRVTKDPAPFLPLPPRGTSRPMAGNLFWTYWYFHIPNYLLRPS